MASVYKLTAPRRMGQIPEGFELTVYTNCNNCAAEDVEEALKRAGFTDYESLRYTCSGNWICKQIK